MHNAAIKNLGLNLVYVPFLVQQKDLEAAVLGVRALGIVGVNVTVPHKESIIQFLDDVRPEARRIGSVNTLFWDDGRLVGDSTDGPGFIASLQHDGLLPKPGSRVVVLGAGGSARSVVSALSQQGCSVLVANRTLKKAESLVGLGASRATTYDSDLFKDALCDACLLVNTTSVGMSPQEDDILPVDLKCLPDDCVVSDLIYRPAQTRLLRLANDRGLRTQNGLEMLVRQGALAFEIWTHQEAPLAIMRCAVQESMGMSEK